MIGSCDEVQVDPEIPAQSQVQSQVPEPGGRGYDLSHLRLLEAAGIWVCLKIG